MQEITFRTDNNTGKFCDAAKVYNLIVDDLDHVEGVARGNGVHEDIAMDSDGMLGIERRVFILASCVDDMAVVLDAFVSDALCKG